MALNHWWSIVYSGSALCFATRALSQKWWFSTKTAQPRWNNPGVNQWVYMNATPENIEASVGGRGHTSITVSSGTFIRNSHDRSEHLAIMGCSRIAWEASSFTSRFSLNDQNNSQCMKWRDSGHFETTHFFGYRDLKKIPHVSFFRYYDLYVCVGYGVKPINPSNCGRCSSSKRHALHGLCFDCHGLLVCCIPAVGSLIGMLINECSVGQ